MNISTSRSTSEAHARLAMFELAHSNRDTTRVIEQHLAGSDLTPAQLHAATISIGTAPRAVSGRMQALAQLVGAGESLQRALSLPTAGGVSPAQTERDRIIGVHRVLQPLIDALANPLQGSATPSAARENVSLSAEDQRRFQSVFGLLLGGLQTPDPAARPAFDNGVQQVRVAVMDSGTGGLVAGRTLERVLDRNGDGKVTFAYVTDHGAETYGSKTPEQITRLTNNALRYAQDTLKADIIIMACNTATESFRRGGSENITIPVVNLIDNTANLMVRESREQLQRDGLSHPAMFATPAMASPGNGYELQLREAGIELTSVPCPEWAGYVNRGDHLNENTAQAVLHNIRDRVAQLPLNTTTVYLNCTHYPALQREIEVAVIQRWQREAPNVTPPRVVDPMREQAQAALVQIEALRSQGRLGDRPPGLPTGVTTGNTSVVTQQLGVLRRDSANPDTTVFGISQRYQVPPFDPSNDALPIPLGSMPSTLVEGLRQLPPGFVGMEPNLSMLPRSVFNGYDLNYVPRGADDRFVRVRDEAYRLADTLPTAQRAQVRQQIDQTIDARRRQLTDFLPLKLEPNQQYGTLDQAKAIARVLDSFSGAQLLGDADALPPAPTLQQVRTALQAELQRIGMAAAPARALIDRIETSLNSWVVDTNVHRNVEAHSLAVALSEILAAAGVAR